MTTAATRTAATMTDRELDELVRTHLPLVGHLVRELLRRVPGHISRDDLVSAGMAALAAAARSYEPARGIPFRNFAATRIRGALLDELRSLDWASRSVRSRARQVESVAQQLTSTLGRTPTAQELAEALGTAVDEINAVDEDVQRAVVLSLQGFAPGAAEDLVRERSAGPEDLILTRERIGYLHDAVLALPDRLRHVVTAYFFEERPMAEIAAELGVTESRVSQLRAEALVLMRDGLNSQLDPDLIGGRDGFGEVVNRRRASYYAAISTGGDLHSRLARTNHLALPAGIAA